MSNKTAVLALGLTLCSASALADTHITFVNDKGEVTTQLYVKNGKVRAEGEAGSPISLYDSASNSATVLLPGQRKYIVLNNESANQIGAQSDAAQQKLQAANAQAQATMAQHQAEMDQANKQMESATANLTPEQKAMLQQMGAARGAASATSPVAGGGGMQITIKELGTSETILGHSCRDVQVLVNGQPSSVQCVVEAPTSLGIPAADLKTLQAMRAGMQKLMSHMGMMGQGMAAMQVNGFSIKSTRQAYRNLGMVSETSTLKSVRTGGVDASLFAIPAGYAQTTMQEMMQSGHP